MARNEIKLRKQLIDDDTLQRHRDYSLLMRRHERTRRAKKTKNIFIYSLIVAVITVLLLIITSYFMVRWEKERELKNTKPAMHQSLRRASHT
jgi:hypothetical protein